MVGKVTNVIMAFEAAEDIAAGELVALDANGKLVAATADAKNFVGQAYLGGSAGSKVPVIVSGIIEATAGGAVAPGSTLKMGADGTVVLWQYDGVTYLDTADMVIGKALTGAAATGEKILVKI